MKILILLNTLLLLILTSPLHPSTNRIPIIAQGGAPLTYTLPTPILDGDMSVERALANRRSRRDFTNEALSQQQLSNLLWSAYGVTQPNTRSPRFRGGFRTTPSAGAMYALDIYVAIGNVTGIEAGVYKYISEENKIVRTINRDVRAELAAAALGQLMVREAPITIIWTAIYERMAHYGERGRLRYVYMEIGHSSQNVYLQAEALGLGTCAIAAFSDDRVKRLLELPANEEPLYMMPVGYVE